MVSFKKNAGPSTSLRFAQDDNSFDATLGVTIRFVPLMTQNLIMNRADGDRGT